MKDSPESETLPIYELHPPAWLPRTHVSADLGYPGFHPPNRGQDEDVLSATNVKLGFVLEHSVPAETFSAHNVINDTFRTQPDSISQLEQLLNEVFVRRADRVAAVPPSTFRMPSRVTLNESKRHAWFADLANPDVPLHKLGKSVPHGAKGHDLLDLLHANNVAIPRAIWFLRVFGANETAALRNRPSYNPTQYSVDWANVVTSYIKKQLAEIALPSAPRPGLNIKQTFKGVLSDTDTREKWISRFSYCLQLLRTFYSEGLVDHRTFLTWIVLQMSTCNLAQAGFVVRLADEYLDDMLSCRALVHPFVESSLSKLSEVRTTSAQEFLVDIELSIKTVLQRICIGLPDAFISPKLWVAHSSLIMDIMSEPNNGQVPLSPIMQHSLRDQLANIGRRNEAMLFRNLPPRVLGRLAATVADVQLFNSILDDTDVDSLVYFDPDPENRTDFAEKLDVLLTWSVTHLQYGDHRPFIAVTLLRKWRDKVGDRATRRDFAAPDKFLQDQLFNWLDTSEVARDISNIRDIAVLFGEFVRLELFSYPAYIQRLIARGEPGLSYAETKESPHRNFLRWIPLRGAASSMSSLINQRKVALHGARARQIPEDQNERMMRKEIRSVFPDLFSGEHRSPPASVAALLDECPTLLASSRFEQMRTFMDWLMPILKKAAKSQKREKVNTFHEKSYCIAVELMAVTKCFHGILDLSLLMLECSTTREFLAVVVDTIRRFTTIWTCMDVTRTITTALYTAHQAWRAQGITHSRTLLALLLEMDNGRYLSPESRNQVTADMIAFQHALQPEIVNPVNVPIRIAEILLLAGDPLPEAPSLLANALWFKYRMSHDWAWKVWDNTIESIRHVPVIKPDLAGRQECALKYSVFLRQIDEHLPTGFDDHVLRWFLGPGKNQVIALSADAWEVLILVLLYLIIHGAINTTTILQGLVYPAWQMSAHAASAEPSSLEVFLGAANTLVKVLLLDKLISGDTNYPLNLLDMQRLRTQRRDIYRDPHFSQLVANIPVIVTLEDNENIPQLLRDDVKTLRINLCEDRDFRHGVYHNLDVIRGTFESFSQPSDAHGGLSESATAALELVLGEKLSHIEMSEWQNMSHLLSPWRLSATAIKLQLILRQMGRAFSKESTRANASTSLDNITSAIFRYSMTSEQGYFVAEMTRDVDTSVAGKFINNGLKIVTEILEETTVETLDQCIRRAGELLRLLSHISEPMRKAFSSQPTMESMMQDAFTEVIHQKFGMIESLPEVNELHSRSAVFFARLLQFNLGFHGAWTEKTIKIGPALCSTIFRLIMIYATHDRVDSVAFPVLLDTLFYLIDEMPADNKLTLDPFHNYPEVSRPDISPDIPSDYRLQLMSLGRDLPPNAYVVHMVNAQRDTAGNLVYGSAVTNRPWEWIEHLGDPNVEIDTPGSDRDDQGRLKPKHLVKNSGSLNLETFGARTTSDSVAIHSFDPIEAKVQNSLSAFEDNIHSDNIFQRDWRETRVECEVQASLAADRSKPESTQHEGPPSSRQSVAGRTTDNRWTSPASSVVSRSSAHNSSGSSISRRQSPGQSNRMTSSTASDAMDIEIISSTNVTRKKSGKRKASPSDDEVEIVQGPTQQPIAKKARGKSTTKPRGRKR